MSTTNNAGSINLNGTMSYTMPPTTTPVYYNGSWNSGSTITVDTSHPYWLLGGKIQSIGVLSDLKREILDDKFLETAKKLNNIAVDLVGLCTIVERYIVEEVGKDEPESSDFSYFISSLISAVETYSNLFEGGLIEIKHVREKLEALQMGLKITK